MTRSLLLGLTSFSLGVLAYLIVVNVRQAFRRQNGARKLHISYAIARLGFLILVGLFDYLILLAETVPVNGPFWFYILGVLLTSVGYIGVAYYQRKLPDYRSGAQ